jgi:hypothetical protein
LQQKGVVRGKSRLFPSAIKLWSRSFRLGEIHFFLSSLQYTLFRCPTISPSRYDHYTSQGYGKIVVHLLEIPKPLSLSSIHFLCFLCVYSMQSMHFVPFFSPMVESVSDNNPGMYDQHRTPESLTDRGLSIISTSTKAKTRSYRDHVPSRYPCTAYSYSVAVSIRKIRTHTNV